MYEILANGESIYDPLNPSYLLFSPKVHLEFGKAGSLEFMIPPNNIYYNSLKQMKTIITVEDDDGTEIFRGRVLNIKRTFNNMKEIYCEGDLAYLVDSVQKAVKYDGMTHALFRKLIQGHNAMVEDDKKFTVGNITIDDRKIKLTGKSEEPNVGDIDYKQIAVDSMVDNWQTTYDYIQNALISYCGGYLQTRRQGNKTYIDYWKKHTNEREAVVKFGVNMLDFTEEANIEDEDFFTVLIPLGDDNLTIKKVNNNSDELVNQALVNEYGRIVRTHVFSNVSSPTTLLEDAKRYMKFNEEPPVTLTVKAIDLHLIDNEEYPIYIGDYVRIRSNPHSISRRLVCTEIEYDLTDPENTSYTFGNPKQTLTRRYKEDKRSSESETAEAVGGAGGGIGGAAAAAVEAKAEAVKSDIVDEWINIDPNNKDGIGDLGGLYRYVSDIKGVLENNVGINFNAPEGITSLQSIVYKIDENDKKTMQSIAGVKAKATENGEKITEVRLYAEDLVEGIEASVTTSVKEDVDGKLKSYVTIKAHETDIESLRTTIGGEITTKIDNIKGSLKSKAGIDVDAESGTVNINTLKQIVDSQGETIAEQGTQISSMSDGLQSQIALEARHYTSTSTSLASISLKADELGSSISLKADQIDLDGVIKRLTATEADITDLKAKKITAEEINAVFTSALNINVGGITASGNITAGNVYIGGSADADHAVMNWQDVAARLNNIGSASSPGTNHAHSITENESTGMLTLGYAVKDPVNFDIRATKTYKAGVAAAAAGATVKVEDIIIIDRDEENYPNGDTYWGPSGGYDTTAHILVSVKGVTKQVAVRTSGQKAYDAGSAGAGSGAANAVTVDYIVKNEEYLQETHNTRVDLDIYLNNPNHTKVERTYIISGSEAFGAGRQDVTITSLARDPNSQYQNSEYYDNKTHTTRLDLIAYAHDSDRNLIDSLSNTIWTSDAAYLDGLNNGAGQAFQNLAVDSPTATTPTYDSNSNLYRTTLTATARIGEGSSKSKTTSYSFEATDAFNAGKNKAATTLKITSLAMNSGPRSWYYDTTANKYKYEYRLAASASVEKSEGVATVNAWLPSSSTYDYIDGTDPYNAGKDAGGDSVTITKLRLNQVAEGSGWEPNSNNIWVYSYTLYAEASADKSKTTKTVDTTTAIAPIYGTTPFTAGKNAVGFKDVAVSSSTSSNFPVDLAKGDTSYSASSNSLTGYIKVTLDNPDKTNAIIKVNMNAGNVPSSSVSVESIAISATGVTKSKVVNITAKAKDANGNVLYTQTKQINANKAYNAAKPYKVTLKAKANSFNESTKKMKYTATVQRYDGTEDPFYDVVGDASQAYNAGSGGGSTGPGSDYSTGYYNATPYRVTGSTVHGGQTFYTVKKMDGTYVDVLYQQGA